MTRAFCVIVVFTVLLASCTQKVVCPAYQSAFIYDKDALRKKYSYFKEDSTPKMYTASRNKYLIGVPVSYKKKARSLATVEMVPINPVVPDSLKEGFGETELDKMEMDSSGVSRNVFDSTAVIRIDTLADKPAGDSVYVISKDREIRILKYDAMKRSYFVDTVGYNTEQDNYMWYLREVLVLPDARLSKMQSGKDEKAATGKGEKVAKVGFFKRLFGKKDKQPEVASDSTERVVEEKVDYGYDEFDGKTKDSTEVQEPIKQTPPPEKTKGLLKRKKSEKKKTEPPPAKKEEEGDGF